MFRCFTLEITCPGTLPGFLWLTPSTCAWSVQVNIVGRPCGEDGRSKSILDSFSCHMLENIGPKALVFFFGVCSQTSFLSKFSQTSGCPHFLRSKCLAPSRLSRRWINAQNWRCFKHSVYKRWSNFGVLFEASFSIHIFQLRWNWIALLQSKWCSNSMVQKWPFERKW